MHNGYVTRNGKWPPELVPTPGLLRLLDQLSSESVDAVNGGMWAPAAPIWIGGSGLALSSSGGLIVGGVEVQKSGQLLLGAADYPEFTATRSRTVVIPLAPLFGAITPSGLLLSDAGVHYVGVAGGGFKCILPRIHWPALSTIAAARLRLRATQVPTIASMTSVARFRIARYDLAGPQLTTPADDQDLYRVPDWASGHAYAVGDVAKPATATGYQYRCVQGGTSTTLPTSTTLGATTTDGTLHWITEPGPTSDPTTHYASLPFPAGADPRLYYDSGIVQEITLPVTQNATVPARAATINDDAFVMTVLAGPGAELFHSLAIDFSAAPSLHP